LGQGCAASLSRLNRVGACVVFRGKAVSNRTKSAALRVKNTPALRYAMYRPRRVRSQMSKKYYVVEDKIPLPGGGFAKAVRMALLDMSCLGDGRHLDLTGYPHQSEEAAMMSDWAALGVDFSKAVSKTQFWIQAQSEEGEGDGRTTEASGRPAGEK